LPDTFVFVYVYAPPNNLVFLHAFHKQGKVQVIIIMPFGDPQYEAAWHQAMAHVNSVKSQTLLNVLRDA
jgi:hypothetical protein